MEQLALQEIYPEIRQIGAQLACITPEKTPLPAVHPLAQVTTQMGVGPAGEGLPFFQRLFRAMGYPDEAALMERGVGQDALTDRLLDAVSLLGPVTRCREQLEAFRTAGVALPILMPPMGVEAARTVIQAFRR